MMETRKSYRILEKERLQQGDNFKDWERHEDNIKVDLKTCIVRISIYCIFNDAVSSSDNKPSND
jgi:hypothetical protein